jgi:tetratricopeptide (TPR) repeat protein
MNYTRAFRKAQTLQASGKLQEAEQVYQDLVGQEEVRERALSELARLYLRASKPKNALGVLSALVAEHPANLEYCEQMAQLLCRFGRVDAAVAIYRGLIERQPQLAEAHYNLALLHKKRGSLAEAMASYEHALGLGISREHEVYTNMGVLASEMRRAADARRYFETALAGKADYVPALFNLAAQYEETGEREQAMDLYQRVLQLEPKNREALSRLAYANRVTSKDDTIIQQLRDAIAADDGDSIGTESLYFALGKALDDVGDYQAAFSVYAKGNEIGSSRQRPYDRTAMEQFVDEIIDCCSDEWIGRHSTSLPDSPIFICGMFRSGSTLTEQILGRHEQITAGGELDILPRLLARDMNPYPEKLRTATPQDVERLANGYLQQRAEFFNATANITDKRPDNHLHLGLVKAMFPAARIVYTTRDIRDNCLSVYFQQLGGSLSYATELENAAHYYRQQERLLQHWSACFGDSITVVRYEELVAEPKAVLTGLLDFLGLDWDDRCLDFQDAENPVKTASVWQVREKLHTASSGRWRNYAFALEDVRGMKA